LVAGWASAFCSAAAAAAAPPPLLLLLLLVLRVQGQEPQGQG
jgi:hypothetical protein